MKNFQVSNEFIKEYFSTKDKNTLCKLLQQEWSGMVSFTPGLAVLNFFVSQDEVKFKGESDTCDSPFEDLMSDDAAKKIREMCKGYKTLLVDLQPRGEAMTF